MQETVDRLRARSRELLTSGEVERVIGWRQGRFFWQTPPALASDPEEAEGLCFGPLSAPGLVKYVMDLVRQARDPHLRGFDEESLGTTALWARGCDARAVNRLLQDGVLDREQIRVLGLACPGVADPEKVREEVGAALGSKARITSVAWAGNKDEEAEEGNDAPSASATAETASQRDGGAAAGDEPREQGQVEIVVETDQGSINLELAAVLQDKCRVCTHPTPVVYDELFGSEVESAVDSAERFGPVREKEAMELEERYEFWSRQFDRCIRCYACRNVCPACNCKECVFDSALPDQPDWLSKASTLPEKAFFQLTRFMHVASRCIECGECERVCPMNIPVADLMRKAAVDIEELFGSYEAGLDPEATPPLQTYRLDDPEIEEGGSQ